jgi:hypothetical protein
MVLFWRLVLAHVIADFPLQTDAVFLIKKRFPWGVLLHGILFALTSILVTGPYWNSLPVWGGLLFLWIFHLVVDRAKLRLIDSGHGDHLGYFLLDQAMHVGAIVLVCILLRGYSGVGDVDESSTTLVPQLKLGIAYIVAIWVSPLFSFYLRSAYVQFDTSRSQRTGSGSFQQVRRYPAQPSPLWRIMGYVERGGLVAVITAGGRLFLLIPLILLPRVGLWVIEGKQSVSLWELAVGSLAALSMGLWGSAL